MSPREKYNKLFLPSNDSVDPNLIPAKKLYTGAEMPAIGLGTFGSDRNSGESIAKAVKIAVSVGYRHFDCASVYGNEHLIGNSFKTVLISGIEREELWITSKLWNDKHAEQDVIVTCKNSLKDLKLNYLDLYLIHWPFPNNHPPGCDVKSRNPDAKPYIHKNYMKTWRQMEKLVDMGLTKHIGTSNMTIPKLKLLLRDARIKPVCNQMEIHPHFQQPVLYKFLIDNDIIPVGYSPIGNPNRPERDRSPEDTVDIEDPVIIEIAERLNIHPAVVCIKWAVQKGHIPIPFSTKHKKILNNIQGVISEPLTDKEMNAIALIDKNCRLIKGQVFLWKENQSWEALWDLDGKITPP